VASRAACRRHKWAARAGNGNSGEDLDSASNSEDGSWNDAWKKRQSTSDSISSLDAVLGTEEEVEEKVAPRKLVTADELERRLEERRERNPEEPRTGGWMGDGPKFGSQSGRILEGEERTKLDPPKWLDKQEELLDVFSNANGFLYGGLGVLALALIIAIALTPWAPFPSP